MKEESIFHKFDPRSKLFFILVIIVLSLLIPESLYLGILLLIIVFTAIAGKTFRDLLRYLSPLKYLIPLLLILNLFFYAQGEVFWSIDLKLFALSVTSGGFERSIMILLRFFSIASAAALFAVTTDTEKFESALVRLKIPWKLAFIFSLTLRLVPDIRRRYRKIEEAQLSRGLDLEGGPIKKIKARVPMVIPFLASVIRYGYDLTEALKARNFNSITERTDLIQLDQGVYDYLLYAASIGIFCILIYMRFVRAL